MKNSNQLLKIVLTMLIGSFLLPGFSQTKNNFTIKGTFKDVANVPLRVYLIYPEYFHHDADSAIVKDGSYLFSGYTDEVTQGVVSTAPQIKSQDNISLLLAPGEIDIVSTGQIKGATFSGDGSGATLEFGKIREKTQEKVKYVNKIMESERYKTDKAFQDSTNHMLWDAVGNTLNEMILYARANPNSVITPYLIYSLVSSAFVTPQMADTLISVYPKSAISGRLHQAMLQSIQDRIKKAEDAAAARKKASDEKVPIGSKALNFTANNPQGKPVSLSSFKGKYVLVDFWASWCVPCRQENPNVKKAYETYKEKGFTVLGFSLDVPSQKAAWLAAIKADGLTWTQISDLKGFKGEIATMYVINAIPQNFLIDPNGVIVAKNLRGEELEKTLASIFKK